MNIQKNSKSTLFGIFSKQNQVSPVSSVCFKYSSWMFFCATNILISFLYIANLSQDCCSDRVLSLKSLTDGTEKTIIIPQSDAAPRFAGTTINVRK
jgi:hypothetical protein